MNDELAARQRAISLRLAGRPVKHICSALGTTPKMALLTHRRYLGFEPWDKAFAISERRMQDAHSLLTDMCMEIGS